MYHRQRGKHYPKNHLIYEQGECGGDTTGGAQRTSDATSHADSPLFITARVVLLRRPVGDGHLRHGFLSQLTILVRAKHIEEINLYPSFKEFDSIKQLMQYFGFQVYI